MTWVSHFWMENPTFAILWGQAGPHRDTPRQLGRPQGGGMEGQRGECEGAWVCLGGQTVKRGWKSMIGELKFNNSLIPRASGKVIWFKEVLRQIERMEQGRSEKKLGTLFQRWWARGTHAGEGSSNWWRAAEGTRRGYQMRRIKCSYRLGGNMCICNCCQSLGTYYVLPDRGLPVYCWNPARCLHLNDTLPLCVWRMIGWRNIITKCPEATVENRVVVLQKN